jgi:RimJ/RimL family protein N-acetyltransferase
MPPHTSLETERLVIRRFDPRSDARKLPKNLEASLNSDEQWLKWAVDYHARVNDLYQPPYGDNVIVLKETRQVVGLCGLIGCLIPCELRPEPEPGEPFDGSSTVAGIFYDLMPAQHGKGYATEAAHALVAYAFDELHLPRITATTTADNQASINVIRKLGMRIKFNDPEKDIFPAYMEVVGELVNLEIKDGRL